MQEQVVIKSDNSIILTAPVMIPGAKDCDFLRGEIPFTVDQVRAFKEAYDDYGFVDTHHAIKDEHSADKDELVGNALKSFLLSLLPIIGIIINLNIVSLINYHYYGIYTYNEINSSEFSKAYLKIQEIKDEKKELLLGFIEYL